jgi:MerR family transcriptional regulator, light-induced transcriptional regulator
MNNHISYSIQQVSDRTGLSKQVIRKWEDRYGIIQPERLENGYRYYTQQDVDLLLRIVKLVQAGYAVKEASRLASLRPVENAVSPEMQDDPYAPYIHALIRAGQEANDTEITRKLQQAHHLFGVQAVLEHIATPFLIRIGQLWCDREWGEFQEAMSSSAVRDFLAGLRRGMVVPADAPLVLGSCLPHERHENPMQILLAQCMLRGYRTIMLGPAPAPNAIQSTVLLARPRMVLLTGSTDAVLADGGSAIRDLDEFAATMPEVRFYVGGAGVKNRLQALGLQAIREAHAIGDIL